MLSLRREGLLVVACLGVNLIVIALFGKDLKSLILIEQIAIADAVESGLLAILYGY